MAQFRITNWAYSEEVEQEEKPLSKGVQHLYIENAGMENDVYSITLRSIEDDGVQRIPFYLNKKDGNPNRVARNCLVTLGTALAGAPIGIPFFDDIIHGIVIADVKITVTDDGKEYRNIYKFEPCDEETYNTCKEAGMEVIDQYLKQ